jgi:hypothetical protein
VPWPASNSDCKTLILLTLKAAIENYTNRNTNIRLE